MTSFEILNKHKLKRTSCREGIINVIMNTGEALSENEIRNALEGNYDRTTFYRSFKILEENNIIHKIVVDNQLVKYAIDNSVMHENEHAHFYCNNCKVVHCLGDVIIQNVKLPKGYIKKETEVLIKGLCSNCNV